MRQGNPIKITGFTGMNNIATHSPILPDAENKISPKVILNLDNKSDGTLAKRSGYTKLVSLQEPHSGYSDGNFLFCVAKTGDSIYSVVRIFENGEHDVLFQVPNNDRMYWVRVEDELYMSSKSWCGVYNLKTDSLYSWWEEVVIPDRQDIQDSTWLNIMDVTPASPMEYILLFGSRIWGIRGNTLVYSEPFSYKWFKQQNVISFNKENLNMLAISENPVGLYVSSDIETWFLSGNNPYEMTISHFYSGVVRNTLQYCNFRELGNNVPVWVSMNGIVAGIGGKILSLTENKITMLGNKGEGSALFRYVNGEPQYLANFSLSESKEANIGDKTVVEVFRKGKLIN